MDEMYEDMTIDELNVDEKVKEALKKYGFKYVRQLENKNIRRIYELAILGRKYIDKLEEQLYQLGVEFIDERDENDTMDRFEKWRKENAVDKPKNEYFRNANIDQNNKNSQDENSEVRSDEEERG